MILNWHIDTVFVMHRCMRKDLMRRKEYFRKCLNIERNQVADRVMAVKKTYSELVYADINNIQLKDIWWEKIIDFIMWRIEYVRDLRDSVAE